MCMSVCFVVVNQGRIPKAVCVCVYILGLLFDIIERGGRSVSLYEERL